MTDLIILLASTVVIINMIMAAHLELKRDELRAIYHLLLALIVLDAARLI